MPFVDPNLKTKQTFQLRPTIPINKQLTSAEWRALMDDIDDNWQAHLDLELVVQGLSPQAYVRSSADYNITSAGIYVFHGSTERTFTINDDIDGLVEIRTIATANLVLSGNINSNHLGTIYPGTAATFFRWDDPTSQYTF